MFSAMLVANDHHNNELIVWVVVSRYLPGRPATWDEPPESEEIEWYIASHENGPLCTALHFYAGIDHEGLNDALSALADRESWGRRTNRRTAAPVPPRLS